MPERRGSRLAAEALFLAALAVPLALARLDAIEIAGAMLIGWVVVAVLEWAAWRSEPHYGSGLPPRYYLPSVKLPPPRPLEQVDQGYPEATKDDAPTWIASAALRAEVLGTWPHAAPSADGEDEEPEPVFASPAERDADPWTVAALPAVSAAPEHRRLQATANYSIDPLGDATPRRRFARRGTAHPDTIEVTARPQGPRPLPGAFAGS